MTQETMVSDEFLDQLEESIYWHQEWFTRVMKNLLFRRHSDRDIFQPDAHERCHLGAFLGNTPIPTRYEGALEEINRLHRRMHEAARSALVAQEEGGQIDEEQFDELEEIRSLFFTTLHGLFRAATQDREAARD